MLLGFSTPSHFLKKKPIYYKQDRKNKRMNSENSFPTSNYVDEISHSYVENNDSSMKLKPNSKLPILHIPNSSPVVKRQKLQNCSNFYTKEDIYKAESK